MDADQIAELMVDLFTRLVQDGMSNHNTQTGLDPDVQDLLAAHYLAQTKAAMARLEREMLATTRLDYTTLGSALGISKQAARTKVAAARQAQQAAEAAEDATGGSAASAGSDAGSGDGASAGVAAGSGDGAAGTDGPPPMRYRPVTLEWASRNLPPVTHRVRTVVPNPHLTAAVDPYADLPERKPRPATVVQAVGRGTRRVRIAEDTDPPEQPATPVLSGTPEAG
ncbi:hypothetical protein [Nakamurella aerolata]|uniref:Uncharacterized protein n=1 Tax=Nakamurella aerolata TaxID=1656892 RepID=A0A849A8E0_9ACTN|nr:hypothetical protein [Nakamurella aerolata]NNG36775.1 hypothetical protein [Nakamurella aerolata]